MSNKEDLAQVEILRIARAAFEGLGHLIDLMERAYPEAANALADQLEAEDRAAAEPAINPDTVPLEEPPAKKRTVTEQDLREAMTKLIRTRRDAAAAILEKAGARKLSEVPPQLYPEMFDAVNEALKNAG